MGWRNLFFTWTSSSTGCAIAFSPQFSCNIVNQVKDDNGRVLILKVTINGEKFLLINLYNANSEVDQISVLDLLALKLEEFDLDEKFIPILSRGYEPYF